MVDVAIPSRNCFVDLDNFKSNCFPSIVGGIHNLLNADPIEPLELLELLVPPLPPAPELLDDVDPVPFSPPPHAIDVIAKRPSAIVAENCWCIETNPSTTLPGRQARRFFGCK